jgi:hypothetical protein
MVSCVPARALAGSGQLHINSAKCCMCVKFALHNKHFIQKKHVHNKSSEDADHGMIFVFHPCIILNNKNMDNVCSCDMAATPQVQLTVLNFMYNKISSKKYLLMVIFL